MTIPSVESAKIIEALKTFDDELRNSPKWKGWESNKSHKHAVSANSRLYPVKQIISLATGLSLDSFSGGPQSNDYLRERGFIVAPLHLPSESETRRALHELLLERHPQSVSPQEAYQSLAERFQLTESLRSAEMENSEENHFENRVRQSRRKLVDEAVLDGSEPGVWKLKIRDTAQFWVEKTLVAGRPTREQGPFALGKALWSPKSNESDADSYWPLRYSQPGDFVIHLTDNRRISGVSRVGDFADPNFKGPAGTDWEGIPSYLVKLEGYVPCTPEFNREAFLDTEPHRTKLRAIKSNNRHLFFDRDLNLNQGAYLTPAPYELVRCLDDAYLASSGRHLPHATEFLPLLVTPSQNDANVAAPVSSKPNVWLYAPGKDAEHWDEFYSESIVAIGWNEIGNLGELNEEEIASKMRDISAHENPTNDALACYEFAHKMRPGDLVFAKRGRSRIVGYGTVLGDYNFVPGRENYKHTRRIRWDGRGEWLWSGDQKLATKALTDITDSAGKVSALRRLVALDVDEGTAEVAPIEERVHFGINDAVDGLFVEAKEVKAAIDVWRVKKNLIIQGPPGVGKTFIAQRMAYALMGFKDPSRVVMIQFHQSYNYEDFVQGYRPSSEGLVLKDGHFLEFCRRAMRDKDTTYVFIIDEINRGNLSRIFGELFMLIEADKRSSAWSVPLTYAHNTEVRFFVPENLYILGLMNTADRSLAIVDYALRRRFSFWNLLPQIESPRFYSMLSARMGAALASKVVDCVQELNAEICKDSANLGAGFQIGHSYFCHEIASGEDSVQWLSGVVLNELVPLVSEYWADDPGRAEKWTQRLTRLLSET